MEPGLGRVGGVVADEESIESKRIGEPTGRQDGLCGCGIIGAGERLEAPADTLPKLADPRLRAVNMHCIRFLRSLKSSSRREVRDLSWPDN
jgi:hypothetical protein